MELSDWDARWSRGQIGFHQPAVSGFLEKYADRVWGRASMGTVLVPLCGKSLDMVFLADRAEAVIGVESARQAVEEFFAEQGLTADTGTTAPPRYQDQKYTLFAADFFAVSTQQIGAIDAVYDRASLVALDSAVRVRYVDHLRSLQRVGAKTMLITFDYNQAEMNGPPFAVSDLEVAQLFSEHFVVEHLETREVLNKQFRDRGLSAMTESVFALTRRGHHEANSGRGRQR